MRARSLRGSSTDAERLLWSRLRDRRVAGFKFRRQHPIGSFFADFACLEPRPGVELDGSQHFEARALEADARRTRALEAQGFQVLRFSNRDVLVETDVVLNVIHDDLVSHRPHPNPLPQAGEGVNTKVTS